MRKINSLGKNFYELNKVIQSWCFSFHWMSSLSLQCCLRVGWGSEPRTEKNFQQHPLLREFIINNLFLNYSLQTAEYCKQMNYHLKINAARRIKWRRRWRIFLSLELEFIISFWFIFIISRCSSSTRERRLGYIYLVALALMRKTIKSETKFKISLPLFSQLSCDSHQEEL